MSQIKLLHSGGNGVILAAPTNNPASDVTFKLPQADGSASQVLKTDGSGNLSFGAVSAGITMADQWRINTNFDSTNEFITSNWERNDTFSSYIGSGMTESSGVFTFPSTGIYYIEAFGWGFGQGSTALYTGIEIHLTGDNSTYYNRSNSFASNPFTNGYAAFSCTHLFDVTNTSTHKCKIKIQAANTFRFVGSTHENSTGVTFIRLGDT